MSFCACWRRPRNSSTAMGLTCEPSGLSEENASGSSGPQVPGTDGTVGNSESAEADAVVCKNSRRENELRELWIDIAKEGLPEKEEPRQERKREEQVWSLPRKVGRGFGACWT